MTMHSLTKSAIFFSVGHIAQVKGTQRTADIRGLTVTHPVLGWTLVAGVFAISGLPPFGIFTSEFLVVSSTFAREPLLAVPLVLGLIARLPGALPHEGSGSGVWRAQSGRGAGAGLLPADVRPLRPRAGGRRLLPAADHGVVPACGEAARMRWASIDADADAWRRTAGHLADRGGTLVGLWGDETCVRMAIRGEGGLGVLSLPCPTGSFPSVGAWHTPAIRMERALTDLTGLQAEGATDERPWLDRGRWAVRHPWARQPLRGFPSYTHSLTTEGESLHQVPVGPVHAGIIEPGHFRFTASGETVVRLEERLGFAHRGLESLITGAPLDVGHEACRPRFG